eukprot:757251-Rhodomonas_salina.1
MPADAEMVFAQDPLGKDRGNSLGYLASHVSPQPAQRIVTANHDFRHEFEARTRGIVFELLVYLLSQRLNEGYR